MSRSQLLVALLAAVPVAGVAGAQTPLKAVRVTGGLSRPVGVTTPPGDLDRMFVVEQTGKIRIVEHGVLRIAPFLDLSSLVVMGGERGLLGVAFHPAYFSNGLFYVAYSRASDGATVIASYAVTSDPDVADPASGVEILKISQPGAEHKAGCIQFGPDGFLYIGVGDGQTGGDPQCNAQRGDSLLGKLLRIDVDGGAPYAVPAGNPFVNDPTFAREIWAYGLRNPWRFTFDRATGDLYLGDVGQGEREEVDFQPAASTGGENYGWNVMEGSTCFHGGGCAPGVPACGAPALRSAIHEVPHWQGCALLGGYVYRGCAIPDLDGTYFYADFCTAQIWSFRYDGASVTQLVDRTAELTPAGGSAIDRISSFGEDANGEIYVCDLTGELYKIVPDTLPCSFSLFGQWVPNSTGKSAAMGWAGTAGLCANDLVLTCTGLPPGVDGLFFYGTTRIFPCVPFGNGLRCAGGQIERFPMLHVTPEGLASYVVDTRTPPLGNLLPGSSRYFQFWYRDPTAGHFGFSVSDGLGVTFCP